ncbi:Fur family transcriptional regulator [Paenibacillus mucilaginosus]|uniref:FUR family transcriptional regulator n=3 Tax=Paenibacillus mucilaginosus TaxID=61624 RepID=H6NEC2_9BACL|nr:Fur family transcriptional regulator [Paenibacillus mucilaginosus]AEI46294.1 FUR family transcriptional regulator [Paenibacillus mucilaginosus KNP414]AFC33898.1 FUR family transcriptional regulator [Paenibacillus mucilaginosus 3016]AFH66230.1 Fur family transcriptional regulator [Paenibacillus mucilaginosus K02]MCG7213591.1 transcriptional repressor [Paenibacillus mucilaginosus]WDM27594.1 transcriptional repressor [Paenibacillus mucilaginosus]
MTILLKDASQAMVRSGTRMTAQRQLILEYLFEKLSHPSAEEIHKAIYKDYPKVVSITTIYNNLRTLKELGLVREFYLLNSGVARYDIRLGHHHHLVCGECGRIEDWLGPAPSPVQPGAPLGDHGFLPESFTMEIRGTCQSCANSGGKAQPRAV